MLYYIIFLIVKLCCIILTVRFLLKFYKFMNSKKWSTLLFTKSSCIRLLKLEQWTSSCFGLMRMEVRLSQVSFWGPSQDLGIEGWSSVWRFTCVFPTALPSLKTFAIFHFNLSEIDELWSWYLEGWWNQVAIRPK